MYTLGYRAYFQEGQHDDSTSIAFSDHIGGFGRRPDAAQSTAGATQNLLAAAEADRSLSIFVSGVRIGGMAKMLRDESGPLTVFALSNRAFASLPKDDADALLTDSAAMRYLLGHYVARGSVTVLGTNLRTDIRGEGPYVNSAKLRQPEIPCTNGIIYVLDSFDPGLVRDAVALSKVSRRAQ